jgi:hypothetical protein
MEAKVDASKVRVHFAARQLVYWCGATCYRESGWNVNWFPSYWLIFGNKKIYSVDRNIALDICLVLLRHVIKPGALHKFYAGAVIYALEGLEPAEQLEVKRILETYYVL